VLLTGFSNNYDAVRILCVCENIIWFETELLYDFGEDRGVELETDDFLFIWDTLGKAFGDIRVDEALGAVEESPGCFIGIASEGNILANEVQLANNFFVSVLDGQ